MPSRDLYSSYSDSQAAAREEMVQQAIRNRAEQDVNVTRSQKRAQAKKGYDLVSRRGIAEAAMEQPQDVGAFYPGAIREKTPQEERALFIQEMKTRAFNQANNINYLRQISDMALKKGDLRNHLKYTGFVDDAERKQAAMKDILRSSSAEDIDDDSYLLSMVHDQDTFTTANAISSMRGRPLMDQEMLERSRGGKYSPEVGELLRGRMIDLENARTQLGLSSMADDDDEEFKEGQRANGRARIATGLKQSKAAKIQEGLLSKQKFALTPRATKTERMIAQTDPEAAHKIEIERLKGEQAPTTEQGKRLQMLGGEAEPQLEQIDAFLRTPEIDKSGKKKYFNPTDAHWIAQAAAVDASKITVPGAGGSAPLEALIRGGMDPRYKEYIDKMTSIVSLVIYGRSGQAITGQDWTYAKANYIPQPRDTKRAARDKYNNLIRAARGMKAAAIGRALPEEALLRPSDVREVPEMAESPLSPEEEEELRRLEAAQQ